MLQLINSAAYLAAHVVLTSHHHNHASAAGRMTDLPLANGLVIDTKTGQAMLPSTSPEATIQQQTTKHKQSAQAATIRGRDRSNRAVRRSLVDLPADSKAVTTAGVVWLYFTLGINDAEIAEATGLKLSQVDMIKGLQLFHQLDLLLKDNIQALQSESVQKRIDAMSSKALDGLENLLEDEETRPATRARVLMNMLDRGGFSPKQVTEHRHSLEGGLVIRHIREVAQPKHMPTIDVTPVKGDK
jgi:hypothetical protein